MPVRLAFEACGRSWVADLAGDTDILQRLQNAIDGPSGNPGKTDGDSIIDLVRCGVVVPAGQNLPNGSPLDRDRQTLLPAEPFELSLWSQDATLSQMR